MKKIEGIIQDMVEQNKILFSALATETGKDD
jgi:hypothetical protein